MLIPTGPRRPLYLIEYGDMKQIAALNDPFVLTEVFLFIFKLPVTNWSENEKQKLLQI